MKIVQMLCVLITFVLTIETYSQDRLHVKYPPEQLKEDLRYFLKTAEEIHPNLYHSISREAIDSMRLELEAQITDSMNPIEFGRLVIPLSTKLMDGHTSLWFPYNEAAKAYSTASKFPFQVKIIDRTLYVLNNNSDNPSIQPWDEITQINGISSPDLIDDLLCYKNGELESFRLESLQNSFSYCLWLIKGWGDQFELTIRRGDQYFNHIISGRKPTPAQSNTLTTNRSFRYSFELKGDGIGYLDFRSMSDLPGFRKFLDSTFQVINDQHVNDLIIDVRKNGGGNSRLGDLLFDYLTDRSYQQAEKVRIKTSHPTKQMVKTRLKWFMYPLYPLILVNKQANATLGKKDGSLTEIHSKLSRVSKNKKNRFGGNVYLLTGPGTFSSANMLAAAFSCYEMGTVIGEATGEPLISYGELIYFKLPNSKCDAWSSSKSFYLPCADPNDPNKSVVPDHSIIPRADDIKNNRDAVMEFTLNLIKSQHHEIN